MCTALRLSDRTYSYSEQDVFFVAADRLHDVSVHVLPLYPSHPFKPVASMLCALLIGPIPSGETRRVVCNADLVGRYVVISMAGNDILTLCEVQVHGVPGRTIMGQ